MAETENDHSEEITATDTQQDFEPHEERKASPISGCLIFSILLICMTALVVFCVLFYFKTKRTIHESSDATQTKTAQEKLIKSKLDPLHAKFDNFTKKVRNKEEAHLKLNVDELNLAISSYDKLREFRGALYFTGTEKTTIDDQPVELLVANASLPVRGGLFEENRFIHGVVKIKPTITDRAFFPQFISMTTHSEKELSEFLMQETNKGMVSSYKTDPDISDVFLKLTETKVEDGVLIISSLPNVDPPKQGDSESGTHNILTGLSIFGILFFMFFSTAFFIHWVRKRNRIEKEKQAIADGTDEASVLEREAEEHEKAKDSE